MLQVATRSARKLLRKQTDYFADCCRSSRVVLDLCGGSNVGQTRGRWKKLAPTATKMKPFFFHRPLVRLNGESLESFAKRSSEESLRTLLYRQTRENLKCAFCGHCCGAAFIGGTFEMSFLQPSYMRCNEHNKQVDFILDWCSCHSGGVLWSERARRRKPQNVSGQSSVALSHWRKLSYARCCTNCTNPRKRVLSLRTRSLSRFHIGVRLGRKPQWENFVCFLQCSMISDCPPGHASEVSKERFLEENDFSCSWPLSQQVRPTVSTKRPDIDAWDCMHGLQPPAFRTRWSSNLPHHSRFLPSSAFPFFSPPFSLAVRWSATNGSERSGQAPWLRAADLH